MNIGKGFSLRLSLSTGADCDVTVSYRDCGKSDYIGPPQCDALAFTAAQVKAELLPKLTAQAMGREVSQIIIRNKDVTANVATVWVRDETGADYEVCEESIGADQELIYEAEAGWVLQTHGTIGIVSRMIAPVDVVNAAANTLADVTGLTFPILSGKTYRFRAVIPYTSTATTNGSRWTTNGPALTKLNGSSRYPLTVTSETVNYFTAHSIPAAANANSLTVGNVAVVEGEIQPSADGTFAIQFASENAAGDSITALAGATLEVVRVL